MFSVSTLARAVALPPMQINLVDSEPGFLALKDGWNELTREPLMSWEWSYWWWKHLGQDCQLRIVTAKKDGVLCGVAPLIVGARGNEVCARFLGSGKACTDHLQLTVQPDDLQEFCAAIADQTRLPQGILSDISLFELEGVSPDSNTHVLCQQLRGQFWSYRIGLESTWPVRLPNTWDSFVAARHKSLRRKIRKAEKRYRSGEATARSTLDELEFESAFDTLVALHQNRFVSKGEPGVFADDGFTQFLRNATRDLARRGNMAEIIVAEVDGEAIAAQLYLRTSRGPQMYQSGMRSSRIDLEPGHLLFAHVFKRAIEAGWSEFDFLRGDDRYKHAWGGERSPLHTIRCVSNRIPSTLKHQVIRGLHQLNSWAKEAPQQLGG